MRDHHRMHPFGSLGYLSLAEIFVATVVMKAQDCGQGTFRMLGLEKDSLGRVSKGKLPTKFFDFESVEFMFPVDRNLRNTPDVWRSDQLPRLGLSCSTPCVKLF